MIADINLDVINKHEIDETIILGIADDASNPQNYLMVQKPVGIEFAEADDVYTEFNDQINSAYGAVSEIEISSDKIDIRLNDSGSKSLGRQLIVICFGDHQRDEIVGLFKTFFENTDVKITV